MTVIGVTVALITLTERKIRQTYVKQFSAEFQSLLDVLERSRQSRSGDFMNLCLELAQHEHVLSVIQGNEGEASAASFWLQYVSTLREIDPSRSEHANQATSGRIQITPELLSKLGYVAVMDLTGKVTTIVHPRATNLRKEKFRRPEVPQEKAKEALQQFLQNREQQTVFLPLEIQGRSPVVQEMVSTPVVDPSSGEILGQFLRAANSETDAERSLKRYQEEFGIVQQIQSGVYLGGNVYSRNLSDAVAEELSSSVREFLARTAESDDDMRFEAATSTGEYLIYLGLISQMDSLEPVYQFAAFPVSGLKDDLRDFRLRGSGVGASVLLVAVLLAFLLARNLAGPVNDLVAGTRAIRKGDFDYRVPVKTSDEVGELAASFNEMAEELKQKAIYREILGKVSDEAVAQALVSGTLDLELGGEIREVSVLFCDIRNFTARTETMHPGDIITMLNNHMTSMTELVRKHQGVVDKFVGDEIMAVFGGIKSYGNDAFNAAACALEMVAVRKRLNESMDPPVEIGVGVATGEVVAGCMGSVDRLNYTVLGSRVNLAARLCSAAAPMEVVTDEETIRRISPAPESAMISGLELKGFSNTVSAHRLIAIPVPEPRLKTSARPDTGR